MRNKYLKWTILVSFSESDFLISVKVKTGPQMVNCSSWCQTGDVHNATISLIGFHTAPKRSGKSVSFVYLVIGEVPVEWDAHGLWLPGDEDEAGVLRDGHFLADLLRPLPGVLLRVRVDPRLGVQREVHLANRAMALENSNPSQGIKATRSVVYTSTGLGKKTVPRFA